MSLPWIVLVARLTSATRFDVVLENSLNVPLAFAFTGSAVLLPDGFKDRSKSLAVQFTTSAKTPYVNPGKRVTFRGTNTSGKSFGEDALLMLRGNFGGAVPQAIIPLGELPVSPILHRLEDDDDEIFPRLHIHLG